MQRPTQLTATDDLIVFDNSPPGVVNNGPVLPFHNLVMPNHRVRTIALQGDRCSHNGSVWRLINRAIGHLNIYALHNAHAGVPRIVDVRASDGYHLAICNDDCTPRLSPYRNLLLR